ncbi:MAG: Protoporphyrin IX Mg-chelatase subunit D, partial [uncultured Acetobacteraceae bacterium]
TPWRPGASRARQASRPCWWTRRRALAPSRAGWRRRWARATCRSPAAKPPTPSPARSGRRRR